MFRSVTVKLIAVFLVAWLVTVGTLGLVMGALYRQQLVNQRFSEMEAQGVEIAQLMSQGKRAKALQQMEAAARMFDGPVWTVDMLNGEITAAGQLLQLTDDLREEYLRPALAGQTVRREGTFGGQFRTGMLTLAVPRIENDIAVGAFFIHADMSNIRAGVLSLYRNFGYAVLLSGLLGLTLIVLLSARIGKPLRDMSAMAREMAQGRFGKRVKVRGQDEVAVLGRTFNEMGASLKHLDELRVGFVANVSHELRSPLTSIQGYVQGMRDGVIPQEEYGEYLGIVYDETARMNKLVNDLLDLSRMDGEAFQLNPTRFDLNELIRRTLIAFHGRADDKQLEVEVNFRTDPCFVQAAADRIRQVRGNLLDNAIKFTGQGGRISILTQVSGGKVTVSVSDDGPGIAEEDLPFVFERFFKSEKAHTSGNGTGLGLAITQKIVKQHGQDIWASSEPGKGATFAFTLALAQD